MTTKRNVTLHGDSTDVNQTNATFVKYTQGNIQHASIDRLGMPGRWLRHKLLDGILVGTPVLLTIQRHRTPLRTTIMKMISFLGTEDFYTVLFLFIYWTLDARLGRLFGILMGIGFYTAGFFKTLLCLPRPPSPPVIPEEKAYDWALPSHHSLLGTILPWYIWLYVNVHHDLSSLQLSCIFLVIAVWSFSVLFSRLYLGVHSPADIVSGGFVGVIVLSLWLQVDDIVDSFISQQRIECPLQCIVLFIGLLYIHPVSDPGNPSFTDNCCLAGVVTGLIIGRSQRSRLLGYPSTLETLPPSSPLSTFVYIATMRLIIGAAIIFSMRQLLKFICITVIKIVYQFFGLKFYSSSAYRKADLPPSKHYTPNFCLPPVYIKNSENILQKNEEKTSSSDPKDSCCMEEENSISVVLMGCDKRLKPVPWDVDVPTKCILYTILTYIAVEIVPRIFLLCGL